MSGTVTQRGELAIIDKHSRATAAIKAGADVVLELPSEFACASADIFSAKALQIMDATGVVTHLSFGCQTGALDGVKALAGLPTLYDTPNIADAQRAPLRSYAAQYQLFASEKCPEYAHLLKDANNLLGICYLRNLSPHIVPIAVTRQGVAHDGGIAGGYASASAIRKIWRCGEDEPYTTPEMAEIFAAQKGRGFAPILIAHNRRGLLQKLRGLTAEEWRALPDVTEGLEYKFMQAVAQAKTFDELLQAVKSKRYTLARLRRIAMCAYLGITAERQQAPPQYLRVLALSQAGRGILKQMSLTASLPIIIKPSKHRDFLTFEANVTDLATLCRPMIGVAGGEWQASPFVEGK